MHLELLLAVADQPAINTDILHVEPLALDVVGRLGLLPRPDLDELVLVEEVDAGGIATHVEVLSQVPPFFETHLREIVSPVVAETDDASWLQQPVNIVDGLAPLGRRQRREDGGGGRRGGRRGGGGGGRRGARGGPRGGLY